MPNSVRESKAAHVREALRGFVLRLVGDEVLAEDLTQETFLRAGRTASPCRKTAAEQAWLYRIALNLVRDHFRSQARAPILVPDDSSLAQRPSEEDVEQGVLQTEMSDCVLEYLYTLPSPQQEILILHDMIGLTHSEISRVLHISEANARVLLYRARAMFRSVLEQNCILAFHGDPIPCERRPLKYR